MSNSPESVSGTQRVQAEFEQILASRNRILAEKAKMENGGGKVPPAMRQTGLGIQALSATSGAIETITQAAMTAIEQLSARFEHQAREMDRQVAEMEELVAKHGREADGIIDDEGKRRLT